MRNSNIRVPVEKFQLKGDNRFPNSSLPVLFYKGVLDVPFLFAAAHVENLFKSNNWGNA